MSRGEEWRDIPGYEGKYQASNLGRIKGPRGVHKPFKNCNGYLIATLYWDGGKQRTGAHRLVALAFLPNPEDKPQVNHKDGDKENNRPENLEWATCSENNLHRRRVLNGGGGRAPRPVVCLDTGKVYPSITAAAEATGHRLEAILQVCKGRRNRTKGSRWSYVEGVQS